MKTATLSLLTLGPCFQSSVTGLSTTDYATGTQLRQNTRFNEGNTIFNKEFTANQNSLQQIQEHPYSIQQRQHSPHQDARHDYGSNHFYTNTLASRPDENSFNPLQKNQDSATAIQSGQLHPSPTKFLLDGIILKGDEENPFRVTNPKLFCPLPQTGVSAHELTLNHHEKEQALIILAKRLEWISQSEGLNAKISWRIKTSHSALGKLLCEALSIDRNNGNLIKNKNDALNLIARHHSLINCLATRKNTFGQPMTPNHLADQMGLRVILSSPSQPKECYRLLEALQMCFLHENHHCDGYHFFFNHEDPYQKDYIQTPKANGYQSLHLSLRASKDGKVVPIELQIRTQSMNWHAEQGPSAHKNYKKTQQLLTEAFITYFNNQSWK